MPGQSFVNQNNSKNNGNDPQDFYHEQAQHLSSTEPPMNSFPFPTVTTTPDSPDPERIPMFSPSSISSSGLRIKTKGMSSQYRKERERVLTNTPVDTVIQKLIKQEIETQETKRVLRTAIARLDAATQRALKSEQERRNLAAAQAMDGLKVSQGMMDAQQQAAKAQQDTAVCKLQLDQMKQDLRRAKESLRNVEDERDNAEHSASKARAQARKLNEERLVMIAREEGRKQGFDEGVLQGRLAILHERPEAKYITSHGTPLGSGTAFIEEYEDEESEENGRPHQPHQQHPQADMPRGMRNAHASRSGSHAGTRKTPRSRHAPLPERAPRPQPHVSRSGGTASQVNTPGTQPLHTNGNGHVNGNGQTPQQVPRNVGTSSQESAVRQELEAAKEEAESLKREIEQREAITQFEMQQTEAAKKEAAALKREIEERDAIRKHEKRQAEESEREAEKERVRVSEKEKELEREKEELREKEERWKEELRIFATKEEMREAEKEFDLQEKEKMQREMRWEWDQEQEVRAREQRVREARERDKERDKDTPRLPYLPMPPPPIVVSPPTQGVVPHRPTLPSQPPPQLDPPPESKAVPQARVRPPSQPQPQQVQPDTRRHHRRTSSSSTTRSPSSTISMSQFDLVAFPETGSATASGSGSGRGDETDRVRPHVLPDIPEVSEGHSSISALSPPPLPGWLRNPPVDHMKQPSNGQSSSNVEEWRKSTSDAMHTPLSSTSDLLSPGFRPRSQQVANERPDLRRSPSSGSSFIDIYIEPPSRPPSPSHAGHPQGEDISGYLSPKHGPAPLPMDSSQPIIPEYNGSSSEPRRGFVAFASPDQGHGPPRGNGNGHVYPRSPRSIYAGMPATASTSTSLSTSTWSPHAQVPATPRQLYGAASPAPMPYNPLTAGPSGLGPGTGGGGGGGGVPVIPSPPRGSGLYAAASPADMPFIPLAAGPSGPGAGGGGVPVIPSPPRGSATPYPRPVQFGGRGSTPASQSRELPSAPWTRRDDSDSDSEDDRENVRDETTKRNTAANATAGALPIPPPSLQGRW